MPSARPGTAIERVRAMLEGGGRICLFLDVDGTLLELAATPDAVRVDPRLPPLLGRVHRTLDGALALVSGRSIDELDALLAPLRLPAAGVHGFERRDGCGGAPRRLPSRREALEPVRRRFAEFAARDPRLLLEDKGEALALHYRRAPELSTAVLALAQDVLAQLPAGFGLQPGTMVVEVKSQLFSKGSALQEFLREPPFAGRQPVAIGDDFTDVDAFRVVEHLGGLSIAVGERITGRRRLPGPAQVRGFLEELVVLLEASEGAAAHA